MSRHPWSEPELLLLKRNYARSGARGVRAILKRNGYPERHPEVIRHKAAECGLRAGVPKGWVPIVEIHKVRRQAAPAIVDKARREGVAKRFPAYPGSPVVVPEKWLDAYLEERQSRSAVEAGAQRGGWLSAHDLAALLGLSRRHVNACLSGRIDTPLGRALASLTPAIGDRGRRYYRPNDVHAALNGFLPIGMRRAA